MRMWRLLRRWVSSALHSRRRRRSMACSRYPPFSFAIKTRRRRYSSPLISTPCSSPQLRRAGGRTPIVRFTTRCRTACSTFRARPTAMRISTATRFTIPVVRTQIASRRIHTGQKIKISDYILQPAVGGATNCNTSQIMPIGTVAHETGHGFGLPDLYDVQGPTEGIGQWGLMSSGSFTSPLSPARMEAWSLNELGWITLAPLTSNGTYSFDAAPLSDTAYYVNVQGANPRGEYFLLENRQRQQSDSALIRIHCQRAGNPPNCGGGLLILHLDQTKMTQAGNATNSRTPHGLQLMPADGFGNLDASASGNSCPATSMFLGCSNRGDAGDPFPG